MPVTVPRFIITTLCCVLLPAASAGAAVPLLPRRGEVASWREVQPVFLATLQELREVHPPVSLARGDRLLIPARRSRDNRFEIEGGGTSLWRLLRGGALLSERELSPGTSRLRPESSRQVAWILDANAACRVSVSVLTTRKRPMYWELAEREGLLAIDRDESFTIDPADSSLLATHAAALDALDPPTPADRQRLRLLRKIQFLYDIELLERPSGFQRSAVSAKADEATIEGPAHLRLDFEDSPASVTFDGQSILPPPLPAALKLRIPPGRHTMSWSGPLLSGEIWTRRRKPSLAFRERRSIPTLLESYAALPPGDAAFDRMLDERKQEILSDLGFNRTPERSPYAALQPSDAAGTRPERRIDTVDPRFASSWLLATGESYRLRAEARYRLMVFTEAAALLHLRFDRSSLDRSTIDWPAPPGLCTGTLPAETGALSFDEVGGPAHLLLSPAPEGAARPVALRSYRRLPPGTSVVFLLPDDGRPHDLRLQAHDATALTVAPEGGHPLSLRFSPLAEALREALARPRLTSEQRYYLALPPGRRRLSLRNDGEEAALIRLGRRPLIEEPGEAPTPDSKTSSENGR